MKLLKAATIVAMICVLLVSMTGCDALDYRDAIDLYNAGQFDEAADMFFELGDFEDSEALFTSSHYWAAVTRMEAGNYSEALPRFIKLGDYEDSAQRVTECTYQLAVAAFDAGNFADARNYFAELADYRQTQEYLRQINWQQLYDAIAAAGFNNISGFIIEKEIDGKLFSISAMHHDHTTQELQMSVSFGENSDFLYSDNLDITLTRDSTIASFKAGSGFGMDFGDGRIGSTQSASGRLDITTCTPDTPLVIESFTKYVEDNQGNLTESKDPADSLMNDVMAENMNDLMTVIPELLKEAGIEVTLKDIGFDAM